MAQNTASIISCLPGHFGYPSGSPPYGGVGRGSDLCAIGVGKGVGFPAGVASSFLYPFRVNLGYSATTGLKVDLLLADDPNDVAAVVSKNAYFEATIGAITSGTSTFDEDATTGPSKLGTPVLLAVTMPAKAAVLKVATISIVVASMNSVVAGSWAMLKVRRVGTNALDTDPGRVVLLGLDVFDY